MSFISLLGRGIEWQTYFGTLRGVPVHIDRFLRWDQVGVMCGHIFAGSMSGLLAQLERERRRADAVAAFAPELLT